MNQITLTDYEKATKSFKSKFKEEDKYKWIYKSLGRLLNGYAHDRSVLIERLPGKWMDELDKKLALLGFGARVRAKVDYLDMKLINLKEEVLDE
jgi:hypothetical protein